MRLITFNIAYGTGGPRNMKESLLHAGRYLRTPRRNIEKIRRFLSSHHPDIVALVEIDIGSFRTRSVNQAQLVASALGARVQAGVKYGKRSIGRSIPILRRQGNAIFTTLEGSIIKYHYLAAGFKRLVIELDWNGVSVFLVHLALHGATRGRQLRLLRTLLPSGRPFIVTGDFNTLRGAQELEELRNDYSLANANAANEPTFPAWKPEKELDFILYSPGIVPTGFRVPQVRCSDHLPLIFDFELEAQRAQGETQNGIS